MLQSIFQRQTFRAGLFAALLLCGILGSPSFPAYAEEGGDGIENASSAEQPVSEKSSGRSGIGSWFKALRSKGELGAEGRFFYPDERKKNAEDIGLGLVGRLEVETPREDDFEAKLRAFGRTDFFDHERSQFVLEELYLGGRSGPFHIRAGAEIFNWSAAEAFHPADILNSRNFDSNVENAEKLGEPNVNASYQWGRGTLTVYYLPALIDPILPSQKSRLSFVPPEIDLGEPLFFEWGGRQSDDPIAQQWAAQVTQSISSADFAFQVVQHVDRSQPVVAVDPFTGQPRPAYLFVTHVGGTYSQAIAGWLLKMETAYRWFDDPGPTPWGFLHQKDHAQIALGVEYGWSNQNGSDSTLIAEFQTILDTSRRERADLSPFQRDLLIGFRHAFNNVMGSELFLSAILDVERKEEYLLNAKYQQRLSDTWKVETGVRAIIAPPKEPQPVGLETLHKANQIFITLTRFF